MTTSSYTFDESKYFPERWQSTNLGALTTAYTVPASCSAPCIKPLVDAYTYTYTDGIHYSGPAVIGSACSWSGNEHSACAPISYASNITRGFYSPAACPDGYTTACLATGQIAFPESVTAHICCPLSYFCDRAYERCFSIVPEGSTLTMDLLRVPESENYWSSVTTTAVETIRTVYYDGITIAYQSTDTEVIKLLQRTAFPPATAIPTPNITPGATSTGVSPTGSHIPEPASGGLKTAALAGIGVGAGVAVLLIILAMLLYLRRVKKALRKARKGNEDGEDMDMMRRKAELAADDTERKVPILVEADAVPKLHEVPAEEQVKEIDTLEKVIEMESPVKVIEMASPVEVIEMETPERHELPAYEEVAHEMPGTREGG